MEKNTSSDSLEVEIKDVKLSTGMGTQRRHFRAEGLENSLLEDNESAESLALEKEEKIDLSRTLHHAHRRKWNALVSFLMIAISLPLFAFGGYAVHLQHQLVDEELHTWRHFQSVSQKLATIFPILFATVVGWSLKKLAQWRLEQGSQLEPLERLMGSQTFGSTIITQCKLGLFHISAVFLVLIWTLSPLGSQSSLQIVHLQQRQDNITNGTAVYFDTSAKLGFSTPNFKGNISLNALFSSCLMAEFSPPVGGSVNNIVDPFGNILIPDLPNLIRQYPDNIKANATGWYSIYFPFSLDAGSSILGIPSTLNGSEEDVTSNGSNVTYTMETSFLSLNCSNNIFSQDGGVPYIPLDESLFASATNGSLANDTFYGIKSSATFSLAINGFYQQGPYGSVWDLLNDTSTYEPRTLLFQSQTNATGPSNVTSGFCQLTTSYMESEVFCLLSQDTPNSCQVISMRPSLLPHPNSNLTDLGFIGTFSSFSESITAASIVPSGTSSALELYVEYPYSALQAGVIAADLSETDLETLTSNLQKALNGYLYGSYNPSVFMGGFPFVIPANRTTPATLSLWTEEYLCNAEWLFVYFTASLIMLSAAVIGTILNHNSSAPDVLGYCSTLVKDNPYITGSGVGSAMSGFARTKFFSKLRLKLVDVEGENDRGYIALVQDDGQYPPLQRKSARLYR